VLNNLHPPGWTWGCEVMNMNDLSATVAPNGFVPVDVYNRCKDRLIHAEANYGEELKRSRALETQAHELSAKLAKLSAGDQVKPPFSWPELEAHAQASFDKITAPPGHPYEMELEAAAHLAQVKLCALQAPQFELLAQLGQQTDQQTEELQAAATLAQSLIGPLEVNAQGNLLFVGITPISCEDPAILEALEVLLSAALRRS
jgi:hypothetical protein